MALKKIYWQEEADFQYRLSVSKKTITGAISLHWHDFYELELVLSGQGEHIYNGQTYPLQRGSLYVMSPADTHAYLTENPISLYHLSINTEWLSPEILEQIWNNRQPILVNEKDTNTISTLFDLLIEEREQHNLYAEITEKSILEILFAVTLRLMGKPITASPEKEAMHKAIAYIQTNFTRPLSLSETATAVGFNHTYFSELFAQKMGRGYNQYLTNLRIEYAKRLLRSSSMRINEICYECGFSSISAFLQAFRKTTNTTPTKYRKHHL